MKLFKFSAPNAIVAATAAGLWLVLIASILCIGISYLLPQDLTRTTRPYATLVELSFFGRVLTFHFALLIALIALLALLLGRRWLTGVAAIFSVALFFPTLIGLWPHDPPSRSGPTLRLMSMNLKFAETQVDPILNQIRKYNPDVLGLEDCTEAAQSELAIHFGSDYPHRYLLFNGLQGLAIFSRLPFAGTHPVAEFSKTRRQIRAVVLFNGRPIAVYIEHPASPRTRQRVLNNRLAMVDLAYQVRDEKVPVIAGGDFNFTSEAPNEAALKNVGLQDAFEQAGQGRGATWPVDPQWMQWLPGVRIDHIFLSRELVCTSFLVGGYDGSDHLPIVADIAMSPQN